MKKILEHLVPFPVDAESDNFTAALASALVLVRGYTEETPYWCTANRRYCTHCSPCGEHPLERMAAALSYKEHTALEAVIMDALDHVTGHRRHDVRH